MSKSTSASELALGWTASSRVWAPVSESKCNTGPVSVCTYTERGTVRFRCDTSGHRLVRVSTK
jgi:hypothetical protein